MRSRAGSLRYKLDTPAVRLFRLDAASLNVQIVLFKQCKGVNILGAIMSLFKRY